MKLNKQYILIILCVIVGFYFFSRKILFPIYAHRHNERILSDIKMVDNRSYMIFTKFIEDIENETDWHVLITSGYRTPKEQERLNRMDARNADAGQSKHNFGKAIDINLYQNTWGTGRWLMKQSSKQRWRESHVLKIAQKYHLSWGGNFKSYYDPVHFEE